MNATDRETLAAALRRAAADLDREAPPAAAWDALRARLRPVAPVLAPALRPVGRVPAPRRAWPVALGLAGLLAASLLLMLRPPALPAPGAEPGFVAVAARESWPAPGAAWLVRAELPRERLAEFGLPFDPTRAGERVPTQLLLRPDGAVLAVRVMARDAAP
ncbi:MAG TPA: hypothetical protein VFQ20_11950 [Burkholderiaceae bacterium]|nr:hypothetical protein [Burkholderiaceae bacterium]